MPAGKRLVVQWVSASLPAASSFNSISFQKTRVVANQGTLWEYHGPYFFITPAGDLPGMNSGAFFTVEPGESPHIRVKVSDLSNFVGSVTIGGYLIDAVN